MFYGHFLDTSDVVTNQLCLTYTCSGISFVLALQAFHLANNAFFTLGAIRSYENFPLRQILDKMNQGVPIDSPLPLFLPNSLNIT